MKKCKLMIISHDLAVGGLQKVVVNICKAIDREIFDVSVLCLRHLGEFTNEIEEMGIKIFCLPQKNRTDYLSFLKVAKILNEQRIDVIHTHNTQPFIDGTIGALLSRVKTIVHTDHARIFPDKIRYMVAERIMSLFAYRVVGVSENTSQNLIKYLKISRNKIRTIYNGIESSKYFIKINVKQFKKELSIDHNWPIIGNVGRLVKEKGLQYLLKAIKNLALDYPKIKLIIVGDGDLKEELKSIALELGIHQHVKFFGNRTDVPKLLKIFDIFVLSSISEGMPMVLLEAMASECPIIATKVGGIPRIIEDNRNGSLVDSGNPDLLSDEIIRVLTDQNLRNKYVSNGKDLIRKKFDMKIMLKKYEALYKRSE
jgi:glycosyltransferase involved in cell wall biosynthesis